jgi:hypothetical protein
MEGERITHILPYRGKESITKFRAGFPPELFTFSAEIADFVLKYCVPGGKGKTWLQEEVVKGFGNTCQALPDFPI